MGTSGAVCSTAAWAPGAVRTHRLPAWGGPARGDRAGDAVFVVLANWLRDPCLQRARAARLADDVAARDRATPKLRRHPGRQPAAQRGRRPPHPGYAVRAPCGGAQDGVEPPRCGGRQTRGTATAPGATARGDPQRGARGRLVSLLLVLPAGLRSRG